MATPDDLRAFEAKKGEVKIKKLIMCFEVQIIVPITDEDT